MALPVLLNVMVCGPLSVPTICEAKVRPVNGARDTTPPTPVPLSASPCGLSEALSAKLSEALSLAGAEGVNLTLTEQMLLWTRVVPLHESEPMLKSVRFGPAMVAALAGKVRSALPLFVTVTVSAELVDPIDTSPKYKLVGDKRTDEDGDAAIISNTAPCWFWSSAPP